MASGGLALFTPHISVHSSTPLSHVPNTHSPISTWDDRLATIAQFTVIGGVGLIVNAFPIFLTLATHLRRIDVNIMIANLTMAEFLLCASFLFGQTFYILWHERLPAEGCHFLAFFHFSMAFASFIFPPVLAINRYISLYYSQIYRTVYSRKRIAIMMASCWGFCSVVPLVFMAAGKTGYDEDNDHCCMVLTKDIGWSIAYWVLIIAPLLLFCDGIGIYCNYRIYRKLTDHVSSQRLLSNSVLRKNKEILYFLMADMLFPICFHTTYHIFKFILVDRTNEFLKRFFISLYLVNAILRGVVTIMFLRPYRLAAARFLCRVGNRLSPEETVTSAALKRGTGETEELQPLKRQKRNGLRK